MNSLERLRELRTWMVERERDRNAELEPLFEQADHTGDYRHVDERSADINEHRGSDLEVLLRAVDSYLLTLEA